MNDEKLSTQARPDGSIELNPTIRNFLIVGPGLSRKFAAFSDHFVNANKKVGLGDDCKVITSLAKRECLPRQIVRNAAP